MIRFQIPGLFAPVTVNICVYLAKASLPPPQRYLSGPSLSAVDLRAFMNLVRYDAAYIDAFGLRAGKVGPVSF